METKKVHFTLGEGAGQLIVNIAREHLLYALNPNKSLKTITGSLIGCPTDIALEILLGNLILITSEDRKTLDTVQYTPELKEIYPMLDIEGWSERELLKMKQIAREWDDALLQLRNTIIRERGVINFTVKYDRLTRYFYDGDSDNLVEVDNDIAGNIKCVVLGIKNFMGDCFKTLSVIEWMSKAYPEYIPDGYTNLPIEVRRLGAQLMELVYGDSEVEEYIRKNNINMKLLDIYLENQREIDTTIKIGIKPVDITDGYDAGWLSPEGVYYALNGGIANMLHNQIAEALLLAGIIPVNLKRDNRKNPDVWLERNGWVKIHGDWILYDGWNLFKYGGKPIPITEAQQKQLCRYGQVCHKGLLSLGYYKEKVSAAKIEMLDIPMLKNYFEL